jgi:hypothetical protein
MPNPVDLEPQAKAVVDANAILRSCMSSARTRVAGPSMNSSPDRSRS